MGEKNIANDNQYLDPPSPPDGGMGLSIYWLSDRKCSF